MGCVQQSLLLRKGNVGTPSSLPVATSSIANTFLSIFATDGVETFFFFYINRLIDKRNRAAYFFLCSDPLTKLAHLAIRLCIRREKLSLSLSRVSVSQSVCFYFFLSLCFRYRTDFQSIAIGIM